MNAAISELLPTHLTLALKTIFVYADKSKLKIKTYLSCMQLDHDFLCVTVLCCSRQLMAN